jgi:hypothetical protein
MSDPWFRPKYTGLGYTPANAKGWAATLIFVLFIVATMALLGDPTDAKSPQTTAWLEQVRAGIGLSGLRLPLAARFALLGVEAVVFLVFARSKSAPPAP